MPKKKASKRRATTRRRRSTTEAETESSSCGVYTAEGGELLANLAKQFNIEESLLTAVNPLLDPGAPLPPFEPINIPSADFDLKAMEGPQTRSRSRSAQRSLEPEFAEDEAMPAAEESGPGWYAVALEEMTTAAEQDPSPRQDLRYLQYLMTTNMASTNDESATGSAFVNWCLIRAGVLGTASTAAFSWLDWEEGTLLKQNPSLGAIVIFGQGSSADGGPHAAFYAGPDEDPDGDTILALGCHRENQPSILPYPKERIISYCWPKVL